MTQHTSQGLNANPLLEDFREDEYWERLAGDVDGPRTHEKSYLVMLQDPQEVYILTRSKYYTLENIEHALRVLKKLEALRG